MNRCKIKLKLATEVRHSRNNGVSGFFCCIPLYSGIYEAKINAETIQVVGIGNRADISTGTIVGQLKSASIYNSVSAAALAVSGVQTASVGGVAGTSDGFILNTSVQPDIHADSSSIYNVGGIVGQATGGQIAFTRVLSPANQQITVGNAVSLAGITAVTHVGGFVGMADATEIQMSSADLRRYL